MRGAKYRHAESRCRPRSLVSGPTRMDFSSRWAAQLGRSHNSRPGRTTPRTRRRTRSGRSRLDPSMNGTLTSQMPVNSCPTIIEDHAIVANHQASLPTQDRRSRAAAPALNPLDNHAYKCRQPPHADPVGEPTTNAAFERLSTWPTLRAGGSHLCSLQLFVQ